mgnify:CR=1 FL=1
MSQLDTPYDVIVIGAGPSGLTTGIVGGPLWCRACCWWRSTPGSRSSRRRPESAAGPWRSCAAGAWRIRSGVADMASASHDVGMPRRWPSRRRRSSLGLPPLGLSRTVSPTGVAAVPQDYLWSPSCLITSMSVGGESRFGTELCVVRHGRRAGPERSYAAATTGDRYRGAAPVTSWERWSAQSGSENQLGTELAAAWYGGCPPRRPVRGQISRRR